MKDHSQPKNTLKNKVVRNRDRGKKAQCNEVQCSAVQCSAVQCSAVQCSALPIHSVVWPVAVTLTPNILALRRLQAATQRNPEIRI